MVKVIKLRKGLNLNLAGRAAKEKIVLRPNGHYALQPGSFEGVTPKVVVKEGDRVKAGDALFVNKHAANVRFASPVSGTVVAVERGERRKVLSVRVDADARQEYVDYGRKTPDSMSGEEVVASLLEAGIFG